MTTSFVGEWALRSAILIRRRAAAAALPVKDPAVRLAAWTAALCGSLLVPALTMTLPAVDLPGGAALPAASCHTSQGTAPFAEISATAGTHSAHQPARWTALLLALYFGGAAVLLLRLLTGLILSRRLVRRSRPTGRFLPGGLPIHDSSDLTVPAALGPVRSLVVLPPDWREWDAPKLTAVLAHEQSHVGRHDPAVQLLSAIHRALLWYSPLSWWMHNSIVRSAEAASDDAALAAIKDRATYAETLLHFMQRGMKVAHWEGVAMARYDKADDRIQRILDGTAISRGVTRFGLATILLFGAPVVFLAAAAGPHNRRLLHQAARSAPRVARYLIVSGDYI